MVIYIKDYWVLETDTDGLNAGQNKEFEFCVYAHKTGEVKHHSNDLNECIKFAENN